MLEMLILGRVNNRFRYVRVDVIVSICNDVFVVVGSVHNPLSKRYMSWKSSAEDVLKLHPGGAVETMKWNRREVMAKSLQNGRTSPLMCEPRVCLILENSQNPKILLSTNTSEEVVAIKHFNLLEKQLFEFISPSARDRVRKEIDAVRRSEVIHYLDFEWKNPSSSRYDIECEAVVTHSTDGLVLIIRRRQQ